MLKRFRVRNFKNLLDIEFRPVGVNLLIGPNNAGKTNLCKALRFLCGSSFLTLDQAALWVLGESWNITNVAVGEKVIEMEAEVELLSLSKTYSYFYSLRLSAEHEQSTLKQPLKVIDEKLVATGERFPQVTLIENHRGAALLTNEKAYLNAGSNGSPIMESQVPPESTALSKVFDTQASRLAVLFKEFLYNSLYFNLEPSALRNPKITAETNLPSPVGGNFSKALFTVHNRMPDLEKKVIEALRSLEPGIEKFEFPSADPDFIQFFLEDKSGHKFSVQSMSDGTLRYLALSFITVILAGVTPLPNLPRLIIFEEPENGLYVGLLKPLFEQMDFTGRNGQCIFTTHSPYVIDLFDAHLEAVHLMKAGSPGSKLTTPDPHLVKKLLDNMPLGEMHYREMLG
jgi:predicted ATPase